MPPIAILWVPTLSWHPPLHLAYHSLVCTCGGNCVVELHGGSWGELCGGAVCRSYVGGAVWWDCGWELCSGSCVVGSCLSPVSPGGPHPHLPGGGVASSGQKKGPDLPNVAEVHKLSASQPLLVTILSYYSVYCIVPCTRVCCHTPIYTHIHQGFSPKPARSNCGLCCCSSLARSFVRSLLLTSSSSYFLLCNAP